MNDTPKLDNPLEGGSSPVPCSAGWMPLETAPTDGTEILVTGLDDGKGPTRHLLIARWEKGNGMWQDHFTNQSGSMHLCHLTHWMPLPSLPNAQAIPPEGSESAHCSGS